MTAPTMEVVTAFQRHFRPARVDGVADHSTLTTLQALLASLPAKQAVDVAMHQVRSGGEPPHPALCGRASESSLFEDRGEGRLRKSATLRSPVF